MQKLEELIELYNALSLCNEAINDIDNEEELFALVCQRILDVSHITMAWIGFANEDETKLEPFSYCGEGTHYVKDISISIQDSDLGNGPSGITYKTNTPYWCQDFLQDPHTAPWHETALQFGWKASAAIPIHRKDKVIGTLNLYSIRLNAFTQHIQDLILKMVSSLDTALTNLENNRAREEAENARNESFNLLSSIINSLPTRVFWKDQNLIYMGCNTVFANDAGKESTDQIIGKSDYDMPWKEQAELYNNDDKEVMDSGKPKLFFDEPQTTLDGDIMWLRTSKVPLKNSSGDIIGIIGIYDNITQQKLTENQLKQSQEHLHAIIENEPACVKLIDQQGIPVDMNPAGLEMLEVSSLEELQKHPLTDYLLPEWREPFIQLHQKVMQGESGSLTFEIRGAKGTRRWLETHAVPMKDSDGNVETLLGLTRDVTEKKASEERILFMANFDTLTQLPNRANMESKIEYTIALSQKNRWTFSLMFLDIDNFKDINDTLGHDIGDKLLIALANRLKGTLRAEDTLAHFGGDEFIILLPNTDTHQAQEIAKKFLAKVYQPFAVDQHRLTVTASIGISIYPDDGTTTETLYKNADNAMYRAKYNGKNNYSFFTEEMQQTAQRNLQLSNAMHDAIMNNEFYLTYQPQISTINHELIGVETLLRWIHPQLGFISPAEFIPLAESNGLILSIGKWVMENAVSQLKTWFENGLESINLSINLSAVQFNQSDLSDQINEVLQKFNFPAKYIDLELTESAIMGNPQLTINTIETLKQLGIKISIDDFGTGYSSLSYLKKFQVNKLKIDQSFVRDITTDPEDKAIVEAIINLSKSLGLKTIAEGVETLEQLEHLQSSGCDEIQGYFFSKPLTAAEFEEKYLTPKK
ncbi:EAL domain-containing protein [Sulfurimonas sp. C5]|uniref:bifunctional diguanylate cyclase/phosphodiesterase n=1 Tax=Sulfurimonas sp. C5 TaxID=3036947 RepID=UPI0024581C18|nr:EAL domain-containing protein [Sulfurimonas sp. C5]MDH4944553.1 EAL domain-containing protein [Sulfurimonas sp. C5]